MTANTRIKLSNAEAAKAPLPESGDYIIRDLGNRTAGLALRVYAGGAKTWITQKKFLKKPKRTVLGSFPDMSHTSAVQKAIDTVSTMNAGIDPALQLRAQKRETERQLNERRLTIELAFEQHVSAKRSTSSEKKKTKDSDSARTKLATGELWKLPLIEVEGKDLKKEYERLKASATSAAATKGGATQAGRIMRTLRAAFRESVRFNKLKLSDPFLDFNELNDGWYRVKGRKVIIASAEGDLKRWWNAVENLRKSISGRAKDAPTIADYMILSLLFGGRSTETLTLKWSNVNLQSRIVIFTEDITKNEREHIIPFGEYARDILEFRFFSNEMSTEPSEYVFNASRKSRTIDGIPGTRTHIKETKKAFDKVGKEAGIKFSPHDLRRTFATLIDETGVSSITLEKALNHAPSTTAEKHYIVKRLAHMRRHYQTLEDKILEEVGVKLPEKSTKISQSELRQFREWQREQAVGV